MWSAEVLPSTYDDQLTDIIADLQSSGQHKVINNSIQSHCHLVRSLYGPAVVYSESCSSGASAWQCYR